MIRLLPLVVLMGLPAIALASGGGEAAGHHDEGIPWKALAVQAGNLGLLLGVLVYVLRHAVKKHFADRQAGYLELVEKADSARTEAERNRVEISRRLQQLEASAKDSIVQAQAEAKEIRDRTINEAKEIAQKLQAEAERSIQVELQKAKTEIRQELLEASVEAARKKLKETVSGPEQKRLQNEFVEKIQVVR